MVVECSVAVFVKDFCVKMTSLSTKPLVKCSNRKHTNVSICVAYIYNTVLKL